MIDKLPSWAPVTERDPAPPPADDPGRPLDLVLTPAERDLAVLAQLHLERERIAQNRRDLFNPGAARAASTRTSHGT